MRVALLAALLFTACTNAKGVAPVEMQTIARGAYGAESERKAVLATSEADYRAQWQALIGEGQIPAVDFEQHVVVFLLGGMRNTGGWSVEPVGVRVEGSTAVVDAKVQGPPPGGMTTQAITYPYAVITINQRGVAEVRWD
jgi:hypothetical protein